MKRMESASLGRQGRGLVDELGLSSRIEVQMGTLGKALGSCGAYICGSAALRDYLVNRARSFIFSTAPPPHCAAASRAAVELLESSGGESLVQRLHENIATLAGLSVRAAAKRHFPVSCRERRKLPSQPHRDSWQRAFLFPAIRYPTVARGAAQIALTVTAAHEHEIIERLASRIGPLRRSTALSQRVKEQTA